MLALSILFHILLNLASSLHIWLSIVLTTVASLEVKFIFSFSLFLYFLGFEEGA